MKNKSYIISVEDNPTDVILMKRIFKQKISNYDVFFFPDTDVAEDFLIQKYSNNDLPKLILLDIKLIKGNGLDLLKYLKRDTRFKQIPVVMLSSSDREDDKTKAHHWGCNQYIEKPRNYEQLNKKLPEIVEFWGQIKVDDTRRN